MARHALAAISNPLITSQQLLTLKQQQGSTPQAESAVFRLNHLTQYAGVLLRLPQEVIATSVILLQRFMVVSVSGPTQLLSPTTIEFTVESPATKASAAAIYLSAKQSLYPLSPRSIINVYALLSSPTSSPLPFMHLPTPAATPDPKTHFVSEGTYQLRRQTLFATEKSILASLSFDTKVTLPYTLALTYLPALSVMDSTCSARVVAHLNAALLSPQLLYLTHQPSALAVAAIYLAAREEGLALVGGDVPWWEVFDVGREELGFLVLSLGSVRGYADAYGGGEG